MALIKTAPTNVVPRLTASDTNVLRDIKPPIEIPSGWAWLWWALTLLAAAAALYVAWKFWQKRRAQAAVIPTVPAHLGARQQLGEARASLGQPQEFCILLSHTIRCYLEERFDFHA